MTRCADRSQDAGAHAGLAVVGLELIHEHREWHVVADPEIGELTANTRQDGDRAFDLVHFTMQLLDHRSSSGEAERCCKDEARLVRHTTGEPDPSRLGSKCQYLSTGLAPGEEEVGAIGNPITDDEALLLPRQVHPERPIEHEEVGGDVLMVPDARSGSNPQLQLRLDDQIWHHATGSKVVEDLPHALEPDGMQNPRWPGDLLAEVPDGHLLGVGANQRPEGASQPGSVVHVEVGLELVAAAPRRRSLAVLALEHGAGHALVEVALVDLLGHHGGLQVAARHLRDSHEAPGSGETHLGLTGGLGHPELGDIGDPEQLVGWSECREPSGSLPA